MDSELLERWRSLDALPRTTPRQLLAHTSGFPNDFDEQTFFPRVQREPARAWEPIEVVDHAAAHGTPQFAPGEGFSYSDTGYVVVAILLEQVTGQPLDGIYRDLVFEPLGMDSTWLEGHEQPRAHQVAHHYHGDLDMTTVSPTIDWAGGGLVTTAPDLSAFVRGLWSGQILDPAGLEQLTRWTPARGFHPDAGCATTTTAWGPGASRLRASNSSATPAASAPSPSMRPTRVPSSSHPQPMPRSTARRSSYPCATSSPTPARASRLMSRRRGRVAVVEDRSGQFRPMPLSGRTDGHWIATAATQGPRPTKWRRRGSSQRRRDRLAHGRSVTDMGALLTLEDVAMLPSMLAGMLFRTTTSARARISTPRLAREH